MLKTGVKAKIKEAPNKTNRQMLKVLKYSDSIYREEEEEGRTTSRLPVSLTPEMVNVQFTMVDQSTPTEEKVPA